MGLPLSAGLLHDRSMWSVSPVALRLVTRWGGASSSVRPVVVLFPGLLSSSRPFAENVAVMSAAAVGATRTAMVPDAVPPVLRVPNSHVTTPPVDRPEWEHGKVDVADMKLAPGSRVVVSTVLVDVAGPLLVTV